MSSIEVVSGRRRPGIRLLGAAVALSLALVACGGDDGDDEGAGTTTGTGTTAPGDAGLSDETIVVGIRTDPSTLDPHVHGDRGAYMLDRHIFDTLVVRDAETNEFVDGLAEEWEVLDDGQRYEFTLKEGVTFHDGTPFDAEAVVFNFERIVDPATNSATAADIVGPYESAEALDDLTVAINYSSSTSATAILDALSQAYLGMVSPTAVAELGEDFGRNPVGTGPFVFEEWVTNDSITLSRNEDYDWAPSNAERSGPPWAARLTFRPVPEAPTRVAALETGDIDFAQTMDPVDAARIEDAGGFSIASAVAPGFPVSFWMNTEAGPTQDVEVRRAILHAFDRDTMLDAIFLGRYMPAYGPLSPVTWAYDESLEDMYPYDPELAGELLDEAGWELGSDGIREKDGEKLTLRLFDLLDARRGEYLQANLEDVGIEVVPRIVASADLFALTRDAEQYEMASTWFASSDPSILNVLFLSSNVEEGFAISRWQDPALDTQLEAGVATVVDDEREELYKEIQTEIMEEALIVPYYSETELTGFDERFSGLALERGQYLNLYAVTGS